MTKKTTLLTALSIIIDWVYTLIMVWLVAECFDIEYSIKMATGIYLALLTIANVFKPFTVKE